MRKEDKTNELVAKAMTEEVSKYCFEYDGYEGFRGINFKSEIYMRLKNILDNGIEE